MRTYKKISTSDIMKKVAEKFSVSVDDIISKSRGSKIFRPRSVAIYLARKLTNLTTTDIGKAFGGRNHSTVLHAINNVDKMLEEEEIRKLIEDMIYELEL